MKERHHLLARTVAVLGLLVGMAGCDASATTGPVGAVRVHAEGTLSRVAVTNRSSTPVYTVTFGRNAVALINWVPCVEGPSCPPLEAGATRLETVARIDGMAETEAVVYWWRAVPGGDGRMRADSIRHVVVRL